MISIEDFVVRGDAPVLISSGISLFVVDSESGRIEVSFPGNRVAENNFSTPMFNVSTGKFEPHVQVARWNEVTVLMGRFKWLIFFGEEGESVEQVMLNRREVDDSGFYSERFEVCSELLMAIYEAGVVAVSKAGQVVWKKNKYWSDVFRSIEHGCVLFENEEGRFSLECSTGVRLEAGK